jgi:hypothetical protein
MSPIINDSEWSVLSNITDDTLVNMAADLSILVPSVIERRSLCDECVHAIVIRATDEGLPFSKYDLEDLEDLSPEGRAAIGRLQGLQPGAKAIDILKAGQKIYRFYQKNRPDNPVAMMVPALLPVIARHASELLAGSRGV